MSALFVSTFTAEGTVITARNLSLEYAPEVMGFEITAEDAVATAPKIRVTPDGAHLLILNKGSLRMLRLE